MRPTGWWRASLVTLIVLDVVALLVLAAQVGSGMPTGLTPFALAGGFATCGLVGAWMTVSWREAVERTRAALR